MQIIAICRMKNQLRIFAVHSHSVCNRRLNGIALNYWLKLSTATRHFLITVNLTGYGSNSKQRHNLFI